MNCTPMFENTKSETQSRRTALGFGILNTIKRDAFSEDDNRCVVTV